MGHVLARFSHFKSFSNTSHDIKESNGIRLPINDQESAVYRVDDVLGDRNCFFHSLCMHTMFHNSSHSSLRADLVYKIKHVVTSIDLEKDLDLL